MKRKLTEEEYLIIVDCFDRLKDEYYFGLMNHNIIQKMHYELDSDFNFFEYWEEIVAIANPVTREEAKEKYVEKEKKYYWISKNHLPNGKFRVLVKSSESYPIEIFYPSTKPCTPFTESEVREACFNPDMFDREEVD